MRSDHTWIVIADGAHVSVVECVPGDPHLIDVDDMHLSAQLPPTRQLVTDRAGRSFESQGRTRHAKEGRSDPHRELKRSFAKCIADRLKATLARHAQEHVTRTVVARHQYQPRLGQTNYCASKAAITGFSKALALEEARNGITVNCVAPGYCATDMVAAVPDAVLQKIVAEIPLQWLGEPSGVARAVAFLAADEAAFITGATLAVNGGQYMA